MCDFVIKKSGKKITSGSVWPGATENFMVDGQWPVVSATQQCRITMSGLSDIDQYTITLCDKKEDETVSSDGRNTTVISSHGEWC
ncbi:uncharacterized protein PgNI_03957 [Pyricularia grisea]|uniref:Uncharacterized protein n=1 Tax=Pyricularia grisea TaxID=148305 RepID=A0A6P8BF60_PYRGI|nr:uncharacterized protein PgNI_03957 [Pyricularia grisea]TLD14425.1 hypothetical protein PgNI_03957 [Pyricularia grisea]